MAHDRQGTKTTIRVRVDIDAAADRAWAFIGDPSNDVVWQRSVLDVDGTLEEARSTRKMLGRRVEAEGSVSVRPEERAVTFEGTYASADGPKYLLVQTAIEPDGDDRCSANGLVTVDTEIFGDGRDHFEEIVRHEMEVNLVNLKHILEAHDDLHAGFAKLPAHA